MNCRSRFLAALDGRRVDRPPVWIMRQAGRTLPEYRAIRAERSFLEVLRTPELAAEVTLQPVRRFGMDAAIVFSDILTIPAVMGQELTFRKGEGPHLEPVVRSREDVAALVEPDIPRDLAYVGETLERVRTELGEDRALVGFAGAPFTLASYMVEGRGTRTFDRIKGLLRAQPDALVALLDRLADLVGDLLEFQLERGADAVQLFDSWAGELSPADYLKFAHPVNQRIAERIERAGGRLILFIRNGSHLFDTSLTTGARALSLDWRVDLGSAAQQVAALRTEGRTTVRCLQGNMDPADLFGPSDCIRERVRAQHDAVAGKVGHIFNLGYGLVPTTPVEGIAAFVRSVQELGSDEPA